jgi:aryl-alcohol dehydrogenase-like predicted oxidoreductase
MKNLNRREFIQKSAVGLAGVTALISALPEMSYAADKSTLIDTVTLGKTGLKVSRIALGTGTKGWRNESDQTHLGMTKFVNLARYAYDKGIHFLDTADMYGSHTYAREVFKVIPREKFTLLTKVMTYDQEGWYKAEPFEKSLDRFRKELGTEYIDIFLMHCMMNGQWPTQYKSYMDGLSEAKQKGIIKALGISCHSLDAMKEAASNPWVDVILARVNHKQARMDDTPEKVMEVLKLANKNGKGVMGMKIFGCGDIVKEEEREQSLNFVIKSKNVHCMTIGMDSAAQIDDTVSRVMRIANN